MDNFLINTSVLLRNFVINFINVQINCIFGGEDMKKKIVTTIFCMLLLSAFSTAVSAGIVMENEEKIIVPCLNNPPTNPIITIPDKVKINTEIVIKVVSTDPEEDKIHYRFKLGYNGKPSTWSAPYDSGIEEEWRFKVFHIGDLIIGSQAMDENGATSDWSYNTITYSLEHLRYIYYNNFLSFFTRLLQQIVL
jgi:hypothetical protein